MTIAQEFIKKLQDAIGKKALPKEFWENYVRQGGTPTFQNVLDKYAEYYKNLTDNKQKESLSKIFWDTIKELSTPIIEDNSDNTCNVYFLFPKDQISDSEAKKGTIKDLYLQGDFHGYGSTDGRQLLEEHPGTGIMWHKDRMPRDALVGYSYIQVEPGHRGKKPKPELPPFFNNDVGFTPRSTNTAIFPDIPKKELKDEYSKHIFPFPDYDSRERILPESAERVFRVSADSKHAHIPGKPIDWQSLLRTKTPSDKRKFIYHTRLYSDKEGNLQPSKAKVTQKYHDDLNFSDKTGSPYANFTRSIHVFKPASNKIENIIVVNDGIPYLIAGIMDHFEKMVREKKLSPNTALVFINTLPGLNNTALPPKVAADFKGDPSASNPGMGVRLIDYKHGIDQYIDFIANKLFPKLKEEKISVPEDPRRRVMIGSSLSGTASIYIGLKHPDLFGAVIAQSPSPNNRAILSKITPKEMQKKRDIHLSCGMFEHPDYAAASANIDYAKELSSKLGIKLNEGRHGHQFIAWNEELERSLPAVHPLNIETSTLRSSVTKSPTVSSTAIITRMGIIPSLTPILKNQQPQLPGTDIKLMPKTESWWENELQEKRKILEAFYNERIIKLDQRSVDEFKQHVMHITFPQDNKVKGKIEKLFADAVSNKINFDNLFSGLKYLPLIAIRRMGLFEKLISEKSIENKESKVDIGVSDLMSIKRYIVEKGMSASIAIGNAEGKLINPEFSPSQSSSFAMHSVGKVFTGMLAMLMIRNGTISEDDLRKPIQLDSSVADALPPMVKEQLKKITLHQVMTHNAGLGDYLGHYCQTIADEKPPEMKVPEDFLKFCENSYYLKATSEIPDEKQAPHCGYFLVKKQNEWILFYINSNNEKNEIKIDTINGLQDALKTLPDKKPEDLTQKDLEAVFYTLNQHYCDNQINKFRYSNVGILLAGLAIKHAYEKKHGPCSYDEILQKKIIQDAGIEHFSSARPVNAKFNKDDPVAPYIAGSPAGGYWTTAADLAKFGQWIHKKCSEDPKLIEFMEKYGQEFYNKDTRIVSHGGAIPSSSAFISVSLNTGQVIATLSDQPSMALELHSMVQNKIFHKTLQVTEKDDLDTSTRMRM